MHWINRYIDQPLLDGAASFLRAWHIRTGLSPERLEPIWNIVVTGLLVVAASHFLAGSALLLCYGGIVMLALPSAWSLFNGRDADSYDVVAYKRLRTKAFLKREAEWAVRLAILFTAICLPFITRSDDPPVTYFMIGACLWFVLTGPARSYLAAAEPPMPRDGDWSFKTDLQFG
ncbi:hypothetical protein FHX08_000368 [Rhizobium sp. BK529]|uniref:hypothetical protein n=1 Tax=unclassified Rhizobium TaxID=2613769 RepID=UPI0010517C90|nr:MULTISPECIES: hypothetical protein [unclassified Rhizobium]MBB3590024.1 hypothetical protein [Rhizobium sp. BK529]TCS04721.1 hypothetical protein EV281_103397 [Rhizobium sp. BK418]